MSDVAARLDAVRTRLRAAATRAGRDPAAVTLVAATKTVPLSLMTPRSKESILSWLRAKAAREPGEPKWPALLADFERAFAR